MAEKSGFFNALLVDGSYDRKYNANDYCDNLATVISNGVLRSDGDDLKVTASGLVPTVAVGRAWIKGHYYINDTPLALAAVTPPIGGSRYDRIMLRLDNTLAQRKVHVVHVQGTASNTPTPPEPTRTDEIYDLVLCTIYITANATSMTLTDTRQDADLCGWVYSTSGDGSFFTSLDNSFYEWFEARKDQLASITLFKRYTWQSTLTSETSAVSFNIPQYNAETCFIEVYINGILETRYTLNNSVLTFTGSLVAGTRVLVNCYKSIDGTGIMSVADEITELQNQMATVIGSNKFAYKCNNVNDNVILSEIVECIMAGDYDASALETQSAQFLSEIWSSLSSADDAQVEIDVVGKFGMSAAYSGTGSAAYPYKYISLGSPNTALTTRKRVVLDFAKCGKISATCPANSSNIIFYGIDAYIKNANVVASSNGATCNIEMTGGASNNGRVEFENCRLSIATTGRAVIARNGTFTNCETIAKSSASSAICFYPQSDSGIIRVWGGKHLSYVSSGGSAVGAIVCTEASQADAVFMAENIHCPTIALTGYAQKNLAVTLSGSVFINGVVSRLASTGSYHTITNLINKSKA